VSDDLHYKVFVSSFSSVSRLLQCLLVDNVNVIAAESEKSCSFSGVQCYLLTTETAGK
jgi:hypothetical protein